MGERREKRKGNRDRKTFVVARMEGRGQWKSISETQGIPEYFLTLESEALVVPFEGLGFPSSPTTFSSVHIAFVPKDQD